MNQKMQNRCMVMLKKDDFETQKNEVQLQDNLNSSEPENIL